MLNQFRRDLFRGWLSAQNNTPVDASSSYSEDTTLIAQWDSPPPDLAIQNLPEGATIFVPRGMQGAFIVQISRDRNIPYVWMIYDITDSDAVGEPFIGRPIIGTSFALFSALVLPTRRYTLLVHTHMEEGATEALALASVDIRSFDVLGVAIEPLPDILSVPEGGLVVNIRSSNPANTLLEWVLRDLDNNPDGDIPPHLRYQEIHGASFTIPHEDLPPGNYRLGVRATIRGGVPGEEMWDSKAFRVGAGYPEKILIDAGHFGDGNTFTHTLDGVTFTYREGRRMWVLQEMMLDELRNIGFANTQRIRNSVYDRIDTPHSITDGTAQQRNFNDNRNRGLKAEGFDLLMQLHSDAATNSSADWAVIIYPMDNRNDSRTLGHSIAEAIRTTMGLDGTSSVRTAVNANGLESFGLMRGANEADCPLYFITENSFHTNPQSAWWLMQDENLRLLAKAYAEVIRNWFRG